MPIDALKRPPVSRTGLPALYFAFKVIRETVELAQILKAIDELFHQFMVAKQQRDTSPVPILGVKRNFNQFSHFLFLARLTFQRYQKRAGNVTKYSRTCTRYQNFSFNVIILFSPKWDRSPYRDAVPDLRTQGRRTHNIQTSLKNILAPPHLVLALL